MEVPWIILAQDARIEEGRVDILGVFYRAIVPALPGHLTGSRLAVRIVVNPLEKGRDMVVGLSLVYPDGQEQLLGAGNLSAPPAGEPGSAADVRIIPIANMDLPVYGRYELRLYIDGEIKASTDLEVVPAPA